MIVDPPMLPSIGITIWLNAARAGTVTATDAANACETLTNSIEIRTESTNSNWPNLVAQAKSRTNPLIVVLPIPGDPCGVSLATTRTLDVESGVVAIGDTFLLGEDNEGSIRLVAQMHAVAQPDLNMLRSHLQHCVQIASEKLHGEGLAGERDQIDMELAQFEIEHLPPTMPSRTLKELHSVAKLADVASHAIENSNALHSPSIDTLRIKLLTDVRRAAQKTMCGLVSR
jgi:hypothetical protein